MPLSTAVDSIKVAADSLKHSGESDSGWILHHVMDARELDFEPLFTHSHSSVSHYYLESILPQQSMLFLCGLQQY